MRGFETGVPSCCSVWKCRIYDVKWRSYPKMRGHIILSASWFSKIQSSYEQILQTRFGWDSNIAHGNKSRCGRYMKTREEKIVSVFPCLSTVQNSLFLTSVISHHPSYQLWSVINCKSGYILDEPGDTEISLKYTGVGTEQNLNFFCQQPPFYGAVSVVFAR